MKPITTTNPSETIASEQERGMVVLNMVATRLEHDQARGKGNTGK